LVCGKRDLLFDSWGFGKRRKIKEKKRKNKDCGVLFREMSQNGTFASALLLLFLFWFGSSSFFLFFFLFQVCLSVWFLAFFCLFVDVSCFLCFVFTAFFCVFFFVLVSGFSFVF
jgi:hypothetical protein